MIASGYELNLYCEIQTGDFRHDDPIDEYALESGRTKFSHELKAVCWRAARRRGWVIDKNTGRCWCPTHAKEGRAELRLRREHST